MADPMPTAPAEVPPAAYEPLTDVTSVSVPTVSIASGSRANRPSGMKPLPASSGSREYRLPERARGESEDRPVCRRESAVKGAAAP